jgi:hypothetical protein
MFTVIEKRYLFLAAKLKIFYQSYLCMSGKQVLCESGNTMLVCNVMQPDLDFPLFWPDYSTKKFKRLSQEM